MVEIDKYLGYCAKCEEFKDDDYTQWYIEDEDVKLCSGCRECGNRLTTMETVIKILPELLEDIMNKKYLEYWVIFEKSETGFGAYALDAPGCISAGDSLEETRKNIAEAIEFHVEGSLEDNDLVIMPSEQLMFSGMIKPPIVCVEYIKVYFDEETFKNILEYAYFKEEK